MASWSAGSSGSSLSCWACWQILFCPSGGPWGQPFQSLSSAGGLRTGATGFEDGAGLSPRHWSRSCLKTLLLCCKYDLPQRVASFVFGERIVSVDHSSAAIYRIDCNLEEIEQVPRPGRAAGAVCADHARMIRCVADYTLSEAGAVIRRLGQIDAPDRARIILAGSGRRIINDVHRACMCGNPRKYCSGRGAQH